MKISATICLGCSLSFTLTAQTNVLDSLKKEWSNKVIDTLELNQLIRLSDQLSESDFE